MRPRAILALTVAAAALTSCRNPFNPSADIELTRMTANGGQCIVIRQANDLSNPSSIPYWNWVVNCHFTYKNKVSAVITSITITYSDSENNPVTAYKSIGGRSFKTSFRIEGTASIATWDETEGAASDIGVWVVDRRVIDEITSPSYPSDKVMFANVIFRGQDANGYDVRLEGRISIFLYP